jgi:hypothetical protein
MKDKWPLQTDLQTTEERLRKTTEVGKISHVHGFVEPTQ